VSLFVPPLSKFTEGEVGTGSVVLEATGATLGAETGMEVACASAKVMRTPTDKIYLINCMTSPFFLTHSLPDFKKNIIFYQSSI